MKNIVVKFVFVYAKAFKWLQRKSDLYERYWLINSTAENANPYEIWIIYGILKLYLQISVDLIKY